MLQCRQFGLLKLCCQSVKMRAGASRIALDDGQLNEEQMPSRDVGGVGLSGCDLPFQLRAVVSATGPFDQEAADAARREQFQSLRLIIEHNFARPCRRKDE